MSSNDRSRTGELADLDIETPAFVYDELILEEAIRSARAAIFPTRAQLLLAMKAFSFKHGLQVMAPLLDGLHASSLFEARLARRILDKGLVHTTTPGLRPTDVDELMRLSDRLSFNSLSQWRRYRSATGPTSPGLRVNPGLSFVPDERYDPSSRNSKLGVPLGDLAVAMARSPDDVTGLEGILVHNNCESVDFGDLLRVVERLVERLDPLLRQVKWVNLGGGYLFGDAEDPGPLHAAVDLLRERYGVDVMFEPGTSLVHRAGALVTTVVDLFESEGRDIAVLDTSVAHAPEVLEYQFYPAVAGTDGCHPYVLAGASCLAGDHFGLHCFDSPIEVGSRVVITEVGAYSLVKASWFNGIALPTVYSRSPSGELEVQRHYTFEDFMRLNGAARADH